MRKVAMVGFALLIAGCVPQTNGKGGRTLVNMMPASPPSFVAGYDFDLLAPVEGAGCYDGTASATLYWTSVAGVADLPRGTTREMGYAEAAATFDALEKSPGADGFMLSRVRYESRGRGSVCATVWGRGVRLKRGGETPAPPAPPPPAAAPSLDPPSAAQ